MAERTTVPETAVDVIRLIGSYPRSLREAERLSSERYSIISAKVQDFTNPQMRFAFEMAGGAPILHVLTFGGNGVLIEIKEFKDWDPDATFKLGAKKS